jgi:hypothetical protein
MENPYLTPPQVESPQSRSWALGFGYGFQGPPMSSRAPEDIGPEDPDTFNEGVLAGQDCAVNGLPLDQPCVDLNVEPPALVHIATSGIEGGLFVWELAKAAWAGAVLSGVLFVVELSIQLETFSDNPDDALSQAAAALQARLQALGFTSSMELFMGGGVDTSVDGCGLQLTAIYRNSDGAVQAATALGRPQWLVASWRTDQSGGVNIVASSG